MTSYLLRGTCSYGLILFIEVRSATGLFVPTLSPVEVRRRGEMMVHEHDRAFYLCARSDFYRIRALKFRLCKYV